MQRVDLFVIDGQNDFCGSGKEPDNWPKPEGGRRVGALHVTGSDSEAVAVAKMIDDLVLPGSVQKHLISKIHATLDSHHYNDCAHNVVWRDRNGNVPPPFTIVSHADVLAQNYVPIFSGAGWQGHAVSALVWAEKYTKALEERGRNPLCLWPVHCEIGKWGQNVYHPLAEAYDRWAAATGRWINFITKGQWPLTEHYSAIIADVPDGTRPETQMNAQVVNDAFGANQIIWCGWAGSHCLKWTALDAINEFGKTGKNDFIAKSVFLEDASAPVANPPGAGAPDFADWRLKFLDEVTSRGGRVMKIKDLVKELKAAA